LQELPGDTIEDEIVIGGIGISDSLITAGIRIPKIVVESIG